MKMTSADWLRIIKENRDEIEERIEEAKREACRENMHGWRYDVEIDESGDVWVSGPYSNGMSYSAWEGTSYVVASIDCWDLDMDVYVYLDAEKELQKEYELINKDLEKKNEWTLTPWEFVNEYHPEKLEEWEEMEMEWVMEEFDPTELLNQTIKELEWDIETEWNAEK